MVVHGSKKYGNADINNNNNESYLSSGNYHMVSIETSQVHAGAGEVSGARDAPRGCGRVCQNPMVHGAHHTGAPDETKVKMCEGPIFIKKCILTLSLA